MDAAKPCRPEDRQDIVARVFQLRVEELMNDLNERQVLGKVEAYTYVIEFQVTLLWQSIVYAVEL